MVCRPRNRDLGFLQRINSKIGGRTAGTDVTDMYIAQKSKMSYLSRYWADLGDIFWWDMAIRVVKQVRWSVGLEIAIWDFYSA